MASRGRCCHSFATGRILSVLYRNEGLKLPMPPLEVDEATSDFTEMAQELGILSEASGKPHAQAVGAIVSTLAVPEQMIVHTPYDRNGHAADYDRYKAPVLEMVRSWLNEHGNPRPIAAKGEELPRQVRKLSSILSAVNRESPALAIRCGHY